MLERLAVQVCQSLKNTEKNILLFIIKWCPSENFCVSQNIKQEALQISIQDVLKDSILWAAPKHRRTVEKRLSRKFGWPDGVWKPLVPKKNLLMCRSCGGHHESGYLCPRCYSEVKKETTKIQETIETNLKLDPVDKEVVVLYPGEKDGLPDEFFKEKRIVEMKHGRPSWFSKSLLEKTTQSPATTTSVKPTDLA